MIPARRTKGAICVKSSSTREKDLSGRALRWLAELPMHKCQRLLRRRYVAFELGIFGCLDHGLELRPGPIACCDKLSSGKQQLRADRLRRRCFILLSGVFVQAQIAVGGGAIHPVER